MTAPSDTWPQERIEDTLDASKAGASTSDVLVEAQFASRTDHSKELRQRRRLVGHGAEDERGDTGIEGVLLDWQSVRNPVDNTHRYGGGVGGLDGELAQVAFRFDGHDLRDGARVVREVESVARAQLDHATRETGQKFAPVLALTRGLSLDAQPREETSEDRMVNLFALCCHWSSLVG
jgi:hypothetical protein